MCLNITLPEVARNCRESALVLRFCLWPSVGHWESSMLDYMGHPPDPEGPILRSYEIFWEHVGNGSVDVLDFLDPECFHFTPMRWWVYASPGIGVILFVPIGIFRRESLSWWIMQKCAPSHFLPSQYEPNRTQDFILFLKFLLTCLHFIVCLACPPKYLCKRISTSETFWTKSSNALMGRRRVSHFITGCVNPHLTLIPRIEG